MPLWPPPLAEDCAHTYKIVPVRPNDDGGPDVLPEAGPGIREPRAGLPARHVGGPDSARQRQVRAARNPTRRPRRLPTVSRRARRKSLPTLASWRRWHRAEADGRPARPSAPPMTGLMKKVSMTLPVTVGAGCAEAKDTTIHTSSAMRPTARAGRNVVAGNLTPLAYREGPAVPISAYTSPHLQRRGSRRTTVYNAALHQHSRQPESPRQFATESRSWRA